MSSGDAMQFQKLSEVEKLTEVSKVYNPVAEVDGHIVRNGWGSTYVWDLTEYVRTFMLNPDAEGYSYDGVVLTFPMDVQTARAILDAVAQPGVSLVGLVQLTTDMFGGTDISQNVTGYIIMQGSNTHTVVDYIKPNMDPKHIETHAVMSFDFWSQDIDPVCSIQYFVHADGSASAQGTVFWNA